MRKNKRIKIMILIVALAAMSVLGSACSSNSAKPPSVIRNESTVKGSLESATGQEPVSKAPKATSGINTPKATQSNAQSTPTPQSTNNNEKGGVSGAQNGQEAVTGGEKGVKEFKVKAVYLTGNTAGDSKRLAHIIDLVKTTELNSIVLDVKDDYGKVNYVSNLEAVKQYMAYSKIYDVDNVIKLLHENNIHVIGRIVCFKDPALAVKRPDLTIKRPDGQVWRENGTTAWINAYNEEAWRYNIDIAKEAIDRGFDEIQFDYVRFPAAKSKEVFFGQNVPTKADAVCSFLETAKKELHDGKGVTVSADVFGIICESPQDVENIGQDLEKVGKDVDYISPMIYPSHFANASQNGSGQVINSVLFSAPDLEPYKVVYNSLVKAKNRISKVQHYKAKIRPYLQDFTASYLRKGYYQAYGAEQVRQQIKAVYDAGYEEWILWDAANTYSEGAFVRE